MLALIQSGNTPSLMSVVAPLAIIGLFCCVVWCRELGENMADDELRAMIDEFDHDGDGESSYDLFFES